MQKKSFACEHVGVNYQLVQAAKGKSTEVLRQQSLSNSWIKANEGTGELVTGILGGNIDCRDAVVAATMIQWLGTDAGVKFFQGAMRDAGYELVQRDALKQMFLD